MKVKVVILFAFLFSGFLGFSQGKYLGVLETHTQSEIELRWLPMDLKTWELGNKNGYLVFRKIVKKNGVDQPGEKLELLNVEPLGTRDSAFLFQKFEEDSTLVGAIFSFPSEDKSGLTPGEANEERKGKEIAYAMSAITTSLDKRVAELAGLYYKDEDIRHDAVYYYEVRIANAPKSTPFGWFVVDVTKANELPVPYGLQLGFRSNIADLSFRGKFDGYSYAYYDIYRSEKLNEGFKKVNNKPYLGSPDPEGKSTGTITFTDTVPEFGKQYFYKLKGISVFGEEGPFTETVQGSAFVPVRYSPELVSKEELADGTVRLRWKSIEADAGVVSHFRVYRNNDPLNPLIQVSEEKIPSNKPSFIDKDPMGANYYRIGSYGFGGDSAFSSPIQVIVTDSTPPSPPTGLVGVADTTGIAIISWNRNTEEDCKGYRIFKRNDEHSGWMRITVGTQADTFFIDTVNLQLGYDFLRYKVFAVDRRSNTSDGSEELLIKRPDIFPPRAPVWVNFQSTFEGIGLEWINDPADDLVKQTLYRMGGKDLNYRPIKVFEGDETYLTNYIDTDCEARKEYTYLFITEDATGYVSDSSKQIVLEKRFKAVREPVGDIDAVVSRENQLIKVFWGCEVNGVQYFKLYRKTPQRGLSHYKTIKGSSREFYDNELKPDSEYSYAVQAVFEDGSKSKLSDLTTVKY
jgi:fibronectin type 3 domain-containing protein